MGYGVLGADGDTDPAFPDTVKFGVFGFGFAT
jgi:hypothetical protein